MAMLIYYFAYHGLVIRRTVCAELVCFLSKQTICQNNNLSE